MGGEKAGDCGRGAIAVADDQVYRIAPGFRLQWEPAQESHVLLYPEGMVRLNPSSAAILQCCDGERPVAAVVEELQAQFPDAPPAVIADDVREFFVVARKKGWIRTQP